MLCALCLKQFQTFHWNKQNHYFPKQIIDLWTSPRWDWVTKGKRHIFLPWQYLDLNYLLDQYHNEENASLSVNETMFSWIYMRFEYCIVVVAYFSSLKVFLIEVPVIKRTSVSKQKSTNYNIEYCSNFETMYKLKNQLISKPLRTHRKKSSSAIIKF